MNRTDLLCVVVSFVKHQTEQHLPHASVGVSLARLEKDALLLQRILVDLEQAARNIQSMRSSEDKLAIDKTVFWAAHALGHRQFYNRVNQRLLRMGLRQAIKLGNQLDPELWQCGWQSGYDDAYGNDIEARVDLEQSSIC
ncbi:Uncharacterised protein [Serratia quinivorans]|uniref:hypothetical protein n=1 Tax=Serratia TaxID=613 RepID=UPI0021784838|nr:MULTISPECIES: hypothetical protein [Serratia]CAI0839035.1 Uncharacterised protein [Serratia quinivorans]CAI1031718.1 Uncharacterised protein [Serratia quinivorans]CAI1035656.1 Uncharacterised protein [Serratia quinivorans]CAI1046774.1 Uncharacterised protein [Serratia quinivorans]CAI1122107.1 Uncharacterised protein [Serratia entomophila]